MAISETDHMNGGKAWNAAQAATKAAVTTDTQILVWSISLQNTTAAIAYLQIFDLQSGSVTVGTTTPSYVFGVPASGSAHYMFEKPFRLNAGFTVAATTTRSGNTGATVETTIVYTSNP